MRKVEFVFHQTNIVWNDKLLRTIYLSGTFYQHFYKLRIADNFSEQFPSSKKSLYKFLTWTYNDTCAFRRFFYILPDNEVHCNMNCGMSKSCSKAKKDCCHLNQWMYNEEKVPSIIKTKTSPTLKRAAQCLTLQNIWLVIEALAMLISAPLNLPGF